jgi:E3 ubiquitin-protein ligase RNF5
LASLLHRAHTLSASPALPTACPLLLLLLLPGQGYVEALTPEQQHQAFLSRLLLMLGSFVIMCLLLF